MSRTSPVFLENTEDIEYIAVRAVLKKNREKAERGLLAGYRPLVDTNTQIVGKDDMFLWLVRGNDVHMLNLDHWEISYIEYKHKGSGTVTHSMSQEKSLETLELIIEAFRKRDITDSFGLIDIDRYENVPEVLKHEADPKTSHNRSGGQSVPVGNSACDDVYGPYWGGYAASRAAGGYAGVTTTYNRKPTTTLFKRTTRYDVHAALERMEKKVEQLRSLIYKPPKLKKIAADESSDSDDDKEGES